MATNKENIFGDFYVEIPDAGWDTSESFVQKIAQEVLNFVSPVYCYGQNYSVNICLTNNQEVHKLNKEYRQKDKPTNVLTFEYQPDEFDMLEPELNLGDIFIAREIVIEEAKTQNKSTEAHLAHLIVHGVLHSFGFDHLNDTEAEQMEELEVRILKNLGYTNPYQV